MAQIHELSRCDIRFPFKKCNFEPKLHCGECPIARKIILRLTNIAAAEQYLNSPTTTDYLWQTHVEIPEPQTVVGYIDNGQQPKVRVATVTEGQLQQDKSRKICRVPLLLLESVLIPRTSECRFVPSFNCHECPKARKTILALARGEVNRINPHYPRYTPYLEPNTGLDTAMGVVGYGPTSTTPIAAVTEGELHLLDTPPKQQ